MKNGSRDIYRIQTVDGCVSCKANDDIWVWSDEILKVWASEKITDWPKWSLYEEESD